MVNKINEKAVSVAAKLANPRLKQLPIRFFY
jgi:hypothetical protein